jgi:glycosyltransferase involved in cell wall biosynthesis
MTYLHALEHRAMRILHVIESMARGGAERNTALLLGPLAGMGVENHLATLWPGRSYDDRVEPYAVRHEFNLPATAPFRALPRLVRLARQADVVHTQLPWANIIGRMAASAAGRPCVTTLHTTAYDPINMARLQPGLRFRTRMVRRLDAVTGRGTRHFFAVSPVVKAVAVKTLGIAPERIEIAPCCVDAGEFNPERLGDRAAVRAALGWPADEKAIIAVGRLIPLKRHKDAIQAVAELARGLRVRFHLVGQGPEETALRQLAASTGAPVNFLGLRDDVPRLLRAADLFVFPSEHEGMPVALLEAMTMGLPCLCSDIPENRAVGAETAAYFPLGDVAGLAQMMRDLLTDPARLARMSQEHRDQVGRYGDPQAAAARFLQSVQAVLRQQNQPSWA